MPVCLECPIFIILENRVATAERVGLFGTRVMDLNLGIAIYRSVALDKTSTSLTSNFNSLRAIHIHKFRYTER